MEHSAAAVSPGSGEAAALMSARHGWLRFTATGHRLSSGLTDDVRPWQEALLAQHRQWYGAQAPVQVCGAFVLQYLLQIPAHAAAFGAGAGVRPRLLADLTFTLDRGGVPRSVELGELQPLPGDLEARLAAAEVAYRSVALGLAHAYRSTRPMSSQQRLGMVEDMWAEAARAVRSAAGLFPVGETRRVSCCLIYALPGCAECAGCPRVSRRAQ